MKVTIVTFLLFLLPLAFALDPIKYSRYSRNYWGHTFGRTWNFFPDTCYIDCYYPKYSTPYWMAGGSTCPTEFGLDEMKTSKTLEASEVCGSSVTSIHMFQKFKNYFNVFSARIGMLVLL